ncbi:17707_t:CDS:1, partial [Gigaspora margarita]
SKEAPEECQSVATKKSIYSIGYFVKTELVSKKISPKAQKSDVKFNLV